ncbi:hypothetical protein L9F63_006709, partial [Diploptera punctata]
KIIEFLVMEIATILVQIHTPNMYWISRIYVVYVGRNLFCSFLFNLFHVFVHCFYNLSSSKFITIGIFILLK